MLYLCSALVAPTYPQRFAKKASMVSGQSGDTNLALRTHQRGSLDRLSKCERKNDENICTERAFMSVSPSECSEGLT